MSVFVIISLREWLCYSNCLSHIYLCILYIKTQKVTFEFILAMNFNFSSFLTWFSFHCLFNETDSPFNFTLLIICQSNANFKTEWVIQNKLLLKAVEIGEIIHKDGFYMARQ